MAIHSCRVVEATKKHQKSQYLNVLNHETKKERKYVVFASNNIIQERNGKTMEKEVLIHVKGLHMIDTPEGDEPIEIVVPGEYYFRNGSHYLRYEEMLDEQGDPTINYIKISSRGMEVRKKGQVNTHMVFEQGKRNMAFYTTPFGTLEMGISATNLELEESDGQIAMKVNYSLDLNQEHVADCCLDIQAQGKNTTGFVL